MTAPKTCDNCGCPLDAGETCDCTAAQTASMEFQMVTDMETFPKTIDFNFEALKEGLTERLELYRGLVVTEDSIKAAKEDRAKLNKLREALETKRKEIKKECMVPYTRFETRIKELVALIDQPIAAIDGQLKGYEDKRRSEKREAALAIYEETIGDLRTLLPFERLWQDAWYNTSVSMKKVREAILAAETKAVGDLKVLATVESEFAEAVKLKYLENLDLHAALAERARLQTEAKRLREYEEQQRQAKIEAAERMERDTMRPTQEEDILQTPYGPEGPAEQTETVYRLCFECQITMQQAKELSKWLKARNIPFRRV